MSFLLKCIRFKIKRKSHQLIAADVNDDIRKDYCSLKRFTWNEIENFTMNFSRIIGTGGFSTVYLARFPDSTLSAVKIYSSSSERLNRVYQQELDILLRLRHRHIVKFLGFSHDREEGILVFEYVSNGSLQEKLHGCDRKGSRLPWKNRMAIAFQLAQAIEYLHDKCTLQIVHGDIKSSNILLDDKLNCKLCDFGSAKLGFSSMVLPPSSSPSSSPYSSMIMMKKQLIMGSPGYTDPNYLRTGIASKKNDVYSFGVVVLELITGMEAFCSEKGQMLTSIASPMIQDDDMTDAIRVAEMVDRRLHGDRGFDLEEAKVMASISALCLQNPPTLRPSAADIIQTMKEKIPSISFLFSSDKKIKK